MNNLYHLLIGVFLLLNLQALNAGKPGWVKNRPGDPAYYIGIGVAQKGASEYQYMTQARNQALKEMSSEIRVTISSNSVLHQFENNLELKEEFESKVESSLTQTLEGYEVFTWENKLEYWVMVRLSKEKYEMNRRISLDKAKKMAASLYYQAHKAYQENDYFGSLSYYVQAVRQIKNHLEEDLTYKSIDGDLNLGIDVYKGIQKVFGSIRITPENEMYPIRFSQKVEHLIRVKAVSVSDEDSPVAGLPVQFFFSKGEGTLTASTATNPEGWAHCSINRLVSKKRLQEITATLNLSTLFNEEDECYSLLKLFFPQETAPRALINIEVEKSRAFLVMEETVFGQPAKVASFGNMIKSLLSDNFFVFTTTQEEADFIIRIHSDFVAGDHKQGSGYSVYMVYGDCQINVVNRNLNTEVFSDGVSSVKGMMPGDYDHALKKCRELTCQQFEKLILPKLEQVDM